EPDDADLGRRVRGLPESSHQARDRRHADDAAPAALAHPGKHRARHFERAGDVHRQVQLPVLVTHVPELAHGVDESGVVDTDVDGAEVALDGGHRRRDLSRIANVAAVPARGPAVRDDLLGHQVRALGIEVENGHLASLGGEGEAIGFTEASRAARDQRHLAADAEIHYLPLNSGSRLPKNAWIPSAASSLRSVGMNASSSISMDFAIGASSPSSTARMMAAVASGARLPS